MSRSSRFSSGPESRPGLWGPKDRTGGCSDCLKGALPDADVRDCSRGSRARNGRRPFRARDMSYAHTVRAFGTVLLSRSSPREIPMGRIIVQATIVAGTVPDARIVCQALVAEGLFHARRRL